MKNRIYIIILHIAGALIALALEASLTYTAFDITMILISITVAILTIINTKYKKNKLLIPKYILTFLVSCQVSYMLFRYFFAIQWGIMIGIYGY